MSVTVHVDFSNGVQKTLTNVVLGGNSSVTGVLDSLGNSHPGLSYEFKADFVDRAGREVGRVKSVDGVASSGGQVWGLWVNDRAISDLRRVDEFSFSTIGNANVEDGDTITLKLLRTE